MKKNIPFLAVLILSWSDFVFCKSREKDILWNDKVIKCNPETLEIVMTIPFRFMLSALPQCGVYEILKLNPADACECLMNVDKFIRLNNYDNAEVYFFLESEIRRLKLQKTHDFFECVRDQN